MATDTKPDPTEMSYEEFVAMIKESEAQYQKGNSVSFGSVEELDKHIRNKSADPTEMSYEEFVARIQLAKEGPRAAMLPDEDLTAYLRRQGYDI